MKDCKKLVVDNNGELIYEEKMVCTTCEGDGLNYRQRAKFLARITGGRR